MIVVLAPNYAVFKYWCLSHNINYQGTTLNGRDTRLVYIWDENNLRGLCNFKILRFEGWQHNPIWYRSPDLEGIIQSRKPAGEITPQEAVALLRGVSRETLPDNQIKD